MEQGANRQEGSTEAPHRDVLATHALSTGGEKQHMRGENAACTTTHTPWDVQAPRSLQCSTHRGQMDGKADDGEALHVAHSNLALDHEAPGTGGSTAHTTYFDGERPVLVCACM
eukprot:scaffold283003_cov17-Tisochrysis_lutea.AAC.1